MDGRNWYVYCDNDPVNHGGFDGRIIWSLMGLMSFLASTAISIFLKNADIELKTAIKVRVAIWAVTAALFVKGILEWQRKLSDPDGKWGPVHEKMNQLKEGIEQAKKSTGPGSDLQKIGAGMAERVLAMIELEFDL